MLNSAGNCFIAVLADEILLEIFSYIRPEWHSRRVPSPLTLDEDYWSRESSDDGSGDEVESGSEEEMGNGAESEEGEDTEEVLAEPLWVPLALVCRKWWLIYDAILYRQLNVVTGWDRNWSLGIMPLLDLLERRPAIQRYPRAISLSLGDLGPRGYAGTGRILSLCKSIRKVALHTRLSSDIWPLLYEIEKLPLLEELSLSGTDVGPSISLIFNHFNLPTIKTMTLDRYGPGVENSPNAHWERVPVSQCDLEAMFPPSKYHTSNVSSLKLSEPATLPMETEHLLRMPANLVNLSLTSLKDSYTYPYYNVVAIQGILDIHRHSLKNIELGIFSGNAMEGSMPDFARFPSLEKLTMSAYNSIHAETVDEALKKLSGPCLRSLFIKFSTEEVHGGHRERPSDFSKTQVKWMKDLAALKQSVASALEFVHIKFNPTVILQTDLHWPWENVEQARQEVAQFGLTMSYESRCNREEWNKLVKDGATKRSLHWYLYERS